MIWLLAAVLTQVPQPPSFEPVFRQAVAQRLKQYGERHAKYAESLVNLALFLQKQNARSAEPERLLRQALAIAPSASVQSAEIQEHLGSIVSGHGAALYLERALAIREKLTPKETEPLLTRLGDLKAEAGKHREAEMFYRRAVDVAQGERLANAYNNVAIALEAQDNLADAEPFYRKSAEAYARALGPQHPEVASVMINLAGAVLARGDLNAAEDLLRRSLTILESTVGPGHPRVADAYESLSNIMQAKGDPAAARRYQERAASLRSGSTTR